VLKYMPPNITPPLVLRYGATDVPIIQLSLSSKSLPDTKLNDLGQNIIRPALAVVHGAEVPYPYGGKPRVIMADLDSQALQARGLSPPTSASALQRQNVILPAGDVKIGDKDYTAGDEQQPGRHRHDQRLPDQAGRRPHGLHARRRARARRLPGSDQFGLGQRHARRADDDPQDRRRLDARGHRRRARGAADIKRCMPKAWIKPLFDQSVFVKAALNSVLMGGLHGRRPDRADDLLFLGNWRSDADHPGGDSAVDHHRGAVHVVGGQTLNTMTLGGFALAVGILVDNGTVVIENIERHVAMREPLHQAIVDGASEVAFRPSCRRCASASSSCRCSCCRARPSTSVSRRCRCR
jgi:Cu/Ag efflux pump CusA